MRNLLSEEQNTSFFLKFRQGIYNFEEIQKTYQKFIENVVCPEKLCLRKKCVCVHTSEEKNESCCECLQCETCCHVLNITLKEQKPKSIFLALTVHFVWPKGQVVTKKIKNHLHFWRNPPFNDNQPCPSLFWRKEKTFVYSLMAQSYGLPIGCYSQPKNHFFSHFLHCQSTVKQHGVPSLQP